MRGVGYPLEKDLKASHDDLCLALSEIKEILREGGNSWSTIFRIEGIVATALAGEWERIEENKNTPNVGIPKGLIARAAGYPRDELG